MNQYLKKSLLSFIIFTTFSYESAYQLSDNNNNIEFVDKELSKNYDVCVIGTGYVGLVLGSGLAEIGNKVICLDIDSNKIDLLNNGVSPIFEPGIEDLILKNTTSRNLYFSCNLADSIKNSQVVVIAVGTPQGPDGKADLSAIYSAAETIGKNLNSYKVICIKSTVPIGTWQKVTKIIRDSCPENCDFDLVSLPEFLREGTAIYDSFNPSYNVVGTNSEKAVNILKSIFKDLFNKAPLLIVSNPTAETIKYSINSFLATKIAFINELANLCDNAGVDISEVTKCMALDHRIGKEYLKQGPGFGGSCFPKDVQALIKIMEEYNVEPKILKSVMDSNEYQKRIALKKLYHLIGQDLKNKTITILGLAFKSGTNDIRNSPAKDILEELVKSEANIKAYDPVAIPEMRRVFSKVNYCNSLEEAISNSDAIIIVTEWKEFTELHDLLPKLDKKPIIIDTKDILNLEHLKEQGFIVDSIGRSCKCK